MNHIPLLFAYRDRIIGLGFTALVESHGRVLCVTEAEGDVWIYGVEPGAIAASGADPKEALEAFRQTFTSVLRDLAADARGVGEFREAVEGLFNAINLPNEVEWNAAVNAVRAGLVPLGDVPRLPAESRRFVDVTAEPALNAQTYFAVEGSTIQSHVAA